MKSFLRFLVNSNIWVGLAVSCLAFLSFPFPLTEISFIYVAFLFLASISAYTYMRWVKLIQNSTGGQPGANFQGLHPNWSLAYCIVTGLIALGLWFVLHNWSLSISLLPALIIALLYPLAFPNPNQAFTSLRTIPMLKLLLISASWSWMSFAMPMFLNQSHWDTYGFMELLFRTLLIAGLTIPFDVRDINYDRTEMKTLPQLLGVERALQWSGILLLTYQLWIVASYFIWGADFYRSIAWILGLEIGAWIIRQVPLRKSNMFVSFWVESIPILTFILAMLTFWMAGNF